MPIGSLRRDRRARVNRVSSHKGISFWDAMIVHAARSAGCSVLYTEDLQHDAVLGGVRIVNPFV